MIPAVSIRVDAEQLAQHEPHERRVRDDEHASVRELVDELEQRRQRPGDPLHAGLARGHGLAGRMALERLPLGRHAFVELRRGESLAGSEVDLDEARVDARLEARGIRRRLRGEPRSLQRGCDDRREARPGRPRPELVGLHEPVVGELDVG